MAAAGGLSEHFGFEKPIKMVSFLGFIGVVLAFVCTCGACGVALRHIYYHLCNYTEPIYQRYIVRIILMVPVSAAEFHYRACKGF